MPDSLRHAVSAAAILIPLILTSCAVTEGAARTRAANEFHCPEEQVVLAPREDLSHDTFDVSACGKRARYTCTRRGRSLSANCAREPNDGAP